MRLDDIPYSALDNSIFVKIV